LHTCSQQGTTKTGAKHPPASFKALQQHQQQKLEGLDKKRTHLELCNSRGLWNFAAISCDSASRVFSKKGWVFQVLEISYMQFILGQCLVHSCTKLQQTISSIYIFLIYNFLKIVITLNSESYILKIYIAKFIFLNRS
jgi:hypothetical protein